MPATRASLQLKLQALGVKTGDVVMVHASVRAVGPVIGGAGTIVQALLDTVGIEGTLTAYVDFEPFYEEGDTEGVPVFDKRIARAARDHGILAETLRNWPGAMRSDHPDAGVVAIGHLAEWITKDHSFQYGYGEGSPFEKIIQAKGKVLMLGAPLDTVTLLHYAEHKVQIADKRIRRYRRLMPTPDGPAWLSFEEFDTSDPVNKRLPINSFELLVSDFLAHGHGRKGMVGYAESVLLNGSELVQYAIEWIENYIRAPSTGRR